MSLRVDTSPLISGALVVGNRGLGVLGSVVPSTGDNGAGYLYNDLTLPADASKEVRGLILTQPSAGTLYAYEDSSFEFTGAPDGTYTFTYRLFVDGADTGVGTVNLQVGSPVAAVSATTALPGFSGSAGQSASATIAAATGLPVFAGWASVDGTPAEAAVYAVTRLPTFSGGATSGSLTDSQKLDLILVMLSGLPSAESIAAAVWQRAIEDGMSSEQMLRIMFSALAGVTSGVGSNTERYMALDGVTPRIEATFDANNNRTSITLDGA